MGAVSRAESLGVAQRRFGAGEASARADFVTLSRVLDGHARHLAGALNVAEDCLAGGDTSTAFERLLQSIQSFSDDVGNQLQRIPEEPLLEASSFNDGATASYNKLRQSLSLSQKKSQALNEDMMRLANDNEELLSAMQTVKATNRRLIDKIQSQNEEVGRLTRQRLDDEQRFEDLRQTQEAEKTKWVQEMEQQLRAAEGEAEAAYQARRKHLVEKLTRVKEGLRSASTKLAGLRSMQSTVLTDVKASCASFKDDLLIRLGQELQDRVRAQCESDAQHVDELEDDAHAMRAKLHIETQTRKEEGEAWEARDRELVADNQKLAAQAAEEHGKIRAEIETAHSTREMEARAGEQERMERAERLRELVVEAASLGTKLRGAHGTMEELQAQCARAEAERQRLDGETHAVSESLRKSDEALDRALENNENLRDQMEQQRADAQEGCDSAIRECMHRFETEVTQLKSQQQQEIQTLADQVAELEQGTAARAAEVVQMRFAVDRRKAECESLQADSTLWKTQEALAERLRNEVERELGELREEWAKRIKALNDEQAEHAKKHMEMEGELQGSRDAFADFNCHMELRASQTRAYAQSVEEKVTEVEDELATVKQALTERAAALAAVRSEASAKAAVAVEARHALEGRLQALAREAADVRDRLVSENATERQRAAAAKHEHEEMMQRSEQHFQLAQAEPSEKIGHLDRAIGELREVHEADGQQVELALEQNRKQIQARQAELAAAQQSLQETEQKLKAETDAMREARAKHSQELAALEDQLKGHKVKHEQSKEGERKMVAQLEQTQRTNSSEQARLTQELSDLMKLQEQQSSEADMCLETSRKQRENEMAVLQGRLSAEIESQDRALADAEGDNMRLQRLVGDLREISSTPGPVTNTRSEVRDMLGRMQRRTDQLRRGLHSPAGAGAH